MIVPIHHAQPYEVDGHLQRKKASHKEEAATEQADLREFGRIDLPVWELARAAMTRDDPLRVELNPASGERNQRAEKDKNPIQIIHDV